MLPHKLLDLLLFITAGALIGLWLFWVGNLFLPQPEAVFVTSVANPAGEKLIPFEDWKKNQEQIILEAQKKAQAEKLK